jgi:hypothetical protein
MQTLNREDLDGWIFDRHYQPDDDTPRPPEAGPLDSAQRKRWAAEGDVYALHSL